ncbi:chitin deacetylase [Dinochytrium kinnereticum]|nr:chitin deacetylase [Dinochytrium kinnereticum]
MTEQLLNGTDYTDFDPDVRECTTTGWALTYDDGPTPFTNIVLDFLDSVGIKATFFVIGVNVRSYPDILLRAYRAGHEIAIHSWSHPVLTTIGFDQAIAEIVATARIVRQLTGMTPRFMRAPTGMMDSRLRSAMKRLGMKVVYWKTDTLDWLYPQQGLTIATAATLKRTQYQDWVSSGEQRSISLEHDAFELGATSAVHGYQVLRNSGVRVRTLSECLGEPAYGGILDAFFDGSVPEPFVPIQAGPSPPPLTIPTYETESTTTSSLPSTSIASTSTATSSSYAMTETTRTPETNVDLVVSHAVRRSELKTPLMDFLLGLILGMFALLA